MIKVLAGIFLTLMLYGCQPAMVEPASDGIPTSTEIPSGRVVPDPRGLAGFCLQAPKDTLCQ